jgi:hypothetical protein
LCPLPRAARAQESDRLVDHAIAEALFAPPPMHAPWFVARDEPDVALGDVDFELAAPDLAAGSESLTVIERIGADAGHFYDRQTLTWFLAFVGAHAAISNSSLDEGLREDYQEGPRSLSTDEYIEFFHSNKLFGEGTYAIPVYAAVVGARWALPESETTGVVGEWGERSLRTVLVGAVPLVASQWTIGSSRPGEEHSESHWEPFNDDNGASGHAFMGAVPFLSAAKMTDRPVLKGLLYVGSTLPGFSRFNDDDHYASQVILGWGIAYLASSAVDDSYRLPGDGTVVPIAAGNATGLGFEWKF